LLTEKVNYDVRGNIHANTRGIARFVYSYNARRQRIQEEYFGEDGKPVNDSDGVHSIVIGYDAAGQKNSEIKRSALGYVVGESKSSATTTRQVRNAKNQVIEEGTYDQSGRLAPNAEGYAIVRCEHDERGNITEWRYFDANDKLVDRRDNGAIVRKKYDSQNHVIEEAYFGTKNELEISREHGVAGGRVKYDQKGKMVEITAFDASGKPMESLYGYAKRRRNIDSAGKPLGSDYYDRFDVRILHDGSNKNVPSDASLVFLRQLGKPVNILVIELTAKPIASLRRFIYMSVMYFLAITVSAMTERMLHRPWNGLSNLTSAPIGHERLRYFEMARSSCCMCPSENLA
jgi:hypothetical protein